VIPPNAFGGTVNESDTTAFQGALLGFPEDVTIDSDASNTWF